VGRGELPPLRARIFLEHRAGDLGVLLEALRTGDALPALEHLGEAPVDVAVEDLLLVVAVLRQPLDLLTLDGERALVLLDAVALDPPPVNDGPLHAGRPPKRGVAHVGGFLAEDRARELPLRRHRAFTLGRDLAAQDAAGAPLGADKNDPRLVEVLERLF